MRYLVPLLLLGAAAFVWHYNATHEGSWLLFPFLDAIPSLRGDRDAQAEWSFRIVAAIGLVSLVVAIAQDVHRRRAERP